MKRIFSISNQIPRNAVFRSQYRTKLASTFQYDLKPSPEMEKYSEIFKKAGNKKAVVNTFKPQPIKKFARKQLFADYIARTIESSKLTLTLRGSFMKPYDMVDFRVRMNDFGFKVLSVKQSDYLAANKYYMRGERDINFINSTKIAKGKLVLLTLENSLLDLFRPGPSNITALRKLLSFTESEREAKINPVKKRKPSDILPWDEYLVVSGYIKDEGKLEPNVWFDPSDFAALSEVLVQLGSSLPTITEDEISTTTPHNLLHSALVNSLQSHVSQVVSPLEQALSVLPETLQGSPHQLSSTLASVIEKKSNE